MWPLSNSGKVRTTKEWGNEILVFSVLLFTVNLLFIWKLNSDDWGMNFTIGLDFDPIHSLWGFIFSYYTPFVIGVVMYSIALFFCGFYLRKHKERTSIFLIPMSILGVLSLTAFIAIAMIELNWSPVLIAFRIVLLIVLLFFVNYMYHLISFLRKSKV